MFVAKKIFLLCFLTLSLRGSEKSEEKQTLGNTQLETKFEGPPGSTQVNLGETRTTSDGKIKAKLSGQKNDYQLSIICTATKKSLLYQDLEEKETPKLYVTASKVALRRGSKEKGYTFNYFPKDTIP